MLKLWGRPNAYNVQKVLWFIKELGIGFEHIDIGSTPGELESEEFLHLNPHARIPVIQHNDITIWESNTIIRYLAATFGPDDYWQEDAAARSQTERWMDWELSSLQPDFIALFWGYYRTPENRRDIKKIDYYQNRCENRISLLDRHLQNNRYVSGKHFGLADICTGAPLYRYFAMGLEVNKPQQVASWYHRLSQRSAFQQVIMTPFDELWGRLDF